MSKLVQEPVSGNDYYTNAIYYKTVEKDRNKTKENFTKACQLGHPKAIEEIDTFFADFNVNDAYVAGGGASAQLEHLGNKIDYDTLDFDAKTELIDNIIFKNNYYGEDMIQIMEKYYLEHGILTVDFEEKFNDFLENNNKYENNATLTRFLDLLFEFCKLYRPIFDCDTEINELNRIFMDTPHSYMDRTIPKCQKVNHCAGCFANMNANNICDTCTTSTYVIPRQKYKIISFDSQTNRVDIYLRQQRQSIIDRIYYSLENYLCSELVILFGKILVLRKICNFEFVGDLQNYVIRDDIKLIFQSQGLTNGRKIDFLVEKYYISVYPNYIVARNYLNQIIDVSESLTSINDLKYVP